ncbi:MAG: glycosyltransferase family 4 protein [bacterium]|nr:glycosyltransferase family 4 protein [bacterium]
MKKMRKILLLAPFDIFPPAHGGSAVVHNYAKYSSRQNKLRLIITHLHSQGGDVDIKNGNIEISYCPPSFFDRLRVFSVLFNPFYLWTAYRAMREFKADLIQCEILWPAIAGIFLKAGFKRPLVLVEHNVEYLKFKDMGGLIHFFLGRIIKIVEYLACLKADRIIVLSQVDKDLLCQMYHLPEDKLKVISPCVDPDDIKCREGAAEKVREKYGLAAHTPLLVFMGNLKYGPNIEGVKYIADIIYPRVLKKYPEARFIIMGQGDDRLREYQRPGLIFTGYLERSDLLAHLAASDIVLVPITTGSGVRIKIFEAAACGKPIVSTQKGAEGLSFIHGEEIYISQGVDSDFIQGIFDLIENDGLRKTMGRKARIRTESDYSWARKMQEFEEVYEECSRLRLEIGN